jgi:hypothetical protein
METEVSYEIFKKEADNSTTLVEAVKGIEQAQKRITELNDGGREEYFIFDPVKANVVDPAQPETPQDPLAP